MTPKQARRWDVVFFGIIALDMLIILIMALVVRP